MTMGNMWAFPSATMSHDTTLDAMKALACASRGGGRLPRDRASLDIAHVLGESLKAAAEVSAGASSRTHPRYHARRRQPFDAALTMRSEKFTAATSTTPTPGSDDARRVATSVLSFAVRLDRVLLPKRRERILCFTRRRTRSARDEGRREARSRRLASNAA
jgi:hypothetical protein